MSELKEKKFGYVVQPPPPPHPCHCAAPTVIPPGMNMQDWMTYINSYIDVRARQIFDKLKSAFSNAQQQVSGLPSENDYIILVDQSNKNDKYKLYINEGAIHTAKWGTDDGDISREIVIDGIDIDDIHLNELSIEGKPIQQIIEEGKCNCNGSGSGSGEQSGENFWSDQT